MYEILLRTGHHYSVVNQSISHTAIPRLRYIQCLQRGDIVVATMDSDIIYIVGACMVRCMTRCLRCPYAALFDASWNQLVALPGHREYMHQELLRHNKIEGATVYGDATFTPTGLTPVSLGARPPDLITSGQGRIGVIWLSPEASWRTHSVIATTHTFIHKLDAEKECWLYSFLVQLPGCVRRISND